MTSNTDLIKLNFSSAKILVVGDVMLDQYWHGETSRISPEAPVPVVKINRTENRPGGAANVAANLVALGCDVKLLGAMGHDSAAEILTNLLQKQNIPHGLVGSPGFSTIVKLRVLCRHQQMIRLDHEDDIQSISLENLRPVYDSYASVVEQYKVVCLSDYAKGVLHNPRPYIEVAKAFGVPVIVDPKNKDFGVYRDAHIVKPNLAEFQGIVGKCNSLEILEERARNLLQICGIKNLVITRGADGISVVPLDGPATHLPACSGEVFDVTGAGDTVLAVLAAALSTNMELDKAAHISTIAAGLAVAKIGTSSVSMQELKQAMHKAKSLPMGVLQPEVLRDVIKQSQARGEKVVFANGCYDLLHHGHINFLERAKSLGDRLVVALNTDESIRRLKGANRPMYNVQQRMAVIAALKAVDWVVPFSEDRPGQIVEYLNPDILVKGDEKFKTIDEIPPGEGVEHVLRNGGSVQLIGRTPECSSSQMLERFEEIK